MVSTLQSISLRQLSWRGKHAASECKRRDDKPKGRHVVEERPESKKTTEKEWKVNGEKIMR